MRSFDFYEFAGILVPGFIAIVTAILVVPEASALGVDRDVSLGDLGVLTIASYAAGHLIQALGNWLENAWWGISGGMPTDWLRTKPNKLLSAEQRSAVQGRIASVLHLKDAPNLSEYGRAAWFAVTRQIYAAVQAAGRAQRVDTFNGNYGLLRGIAASLLVASVLIVALAPTQTKWLAVLLPAAGLAAYRMHRFARHYARELFVQFLQLPADSSATNNSTPH